MDNISRILSWVDSLPKAVEHDNSLPSDATRKRKRKIAPSSCLASPPASFESADSNNTMASTPKKRQLGNVDALADLEVTPRPGTRSFASSSASISLSQATSESGSMARASSSKKQMMCLSLSETVEYKSIWMETKPEVADSLLQTMDDFRRRLKIIPHGLRHLIAQKLEDRNRKAEYDRKWNFCFKPEGIADDDLPGRIPSFEEIERVLRKSRQIYNYKHEEAAWNSHVYLRLLESIYEDPSTGQCSDFNATTYTTARPHREFKSVHSTAKMVDLCVYASLDNNQEWKAAILNLCNNNPAMSINHTDFQPMQYSPLILSIETKKPDAEIESAKLQIGIWHATKWRFLQWAVSEKLFQRSIQSPNKPIDEEQIEFETQKFAALSNLGFIPGIIIHGHQWLFIISTYDDNGKTTIWSECAFGTTENEMGIYAIVAGIRELTA
ncbi:hypothetical protein V8C37DRAFT_344969 [Trichoderma ceciliae]